MDTRLRPWVSTIGTETSRNDHLVHEPDTATAVVFCAGAAEPHVTGPRARAGYYRGTGTRTVIRLTPGRAQSLLGAPVDAPAEEVVPLSALWGHHVHTAAELHEALLARAAAADRSRSNLTETAARLLLRHSVADTARALHVSERHLRTLFTRAVGLSPKTYARIARLRRVPATGGAATPTDLGYYDQSHLTAEFRAAMGVPPSAYFAGRRPESRTC
ncbi:helix-turn-helix transcriptional regulator [Actinosynnema sp. NPDC020468]|uniref:helix-turn-helix domain-containing protein n=1 Tax=Actinosynnema sp. NPDC020468 TaxID=3154488 RepID=UPI0033D3A47D